jgi:mRNA interferase YafQ
MRTIETTSRFRRDFKREAKGQHGQQLDNLLAAALADLVDDIALPARYRDHALTGDWQDFRDCHLKPDLVLIYSKPDDDTLKLVRLGSHSELGL